MRFLAQVLLGYPRCALSGIGLLVLAAGMVVAHVPSPPDVPMATLAEVTHPWLPAVCGFGGFLLMVYAAVGIVVSRAASELETDR